MKTDQMSSSVTFQTIIRRFLLISLPLVLLIIGMSLVIYAIERHSIKKAQENNEGYIGPLLMKVITSDFKSIVSDLMFLTEMHELRDMLNADPEITRFDQHYPRKYRVFQSG